MTEQLKLKLNDSKATRWGALVIVAFTMMAAYYVNDVVAPLKTMLESDLAWTSSDFGFFTGGYSFLNVFFLMLIWGGLILDRFGIRFTGKLSTILMVGGTALEYYAMTGLAGPDAQIFGLNEIFGYKAGVFVAFAGRAGSIGTYRFASRLCSGYSFGACFRHYDSGIGRFDFAVGRFGCFLYLFSVG